MDSTKNDYRALFIRFGKMFLCLALCLTILLNACRTNETRVKAVVGVDDAAFAAVGLTYAVGMVIVTGLVACGMSFATGKDAAECAAEIWNNATENTKRDIIQASLPIAAGYSATITYTTGAYTELNQQLTHWWGSLFIDNSMNNVPISALVLSSTVENSTTPFLTTSEHTFSVTDGRVGWSFKDYGGFSQPIMTIPSLKFQWNGATNLTYHTGGDINFFSNGLLGYKLTGDSTSSVDTRYIKPADGMMFVDGLALVYSLATAGSSVDGFFVKTSTGVAFPSVGDRSNGAWSSNAAWWKALQDAINNSKSLGQIGNKDYFPGIDKTKNDTKSETKVKVPATLEDAITTTAEQARDVAIPATSSGTGTGSNTSSSSSNNASSSPASIMPDGTGPVLNSLVGDTSGSLDALKKLIDSIKDFFAFLAKAFSYVPAEFWVLIIAALVVVIILRVLGR